MSAVFKTIPMGRSEELRIQTLRDRQGLFLDLRVYTQLGQAEPVATGRGLRIPEHLWTELKTAGDATLASHARVEGSNEQGH